MSAGLRGLRGPQGNRISTRQRKRAAWLYIGGVRLCQRSPRVRCETARDAIGLDRRFTVEFRSGQGKLLIAREGTHSSLLRRLRGTRAGRGFKRSTESTSQCFGMGGGGTGSWRHCLRIGFPEQAYQQHRKWLALGWILAIAIRPERFSLERLFRGRGPGICLNGLRERAVEKRGSDGRSGHGRMNCRLETNGGALIFNGLDRMAAAGNCHGRGLRQDSGAAHSSHIHFIVSPIPSFERVRPALLLGAQRAN